MKPNEDLKWPKVPPEVVTERPPDFETPHGKAWTLNLQKARAADRTRTRDGTLAAWVIECRWAHPLWWNYLLYVIHLRMIPGFPPTTIRLPGATHEVGLWALDPKEHPDLVAPIKGILQPANFIGQWIAPSDEEAIKKVEFTRDEILAAKLSPDIDFRRMWIDRFSASNVLG